MTIKIDGDDLKTGLLGLILALVEVIKDLLERQVLRRMEHGSLTEEEIERLGRALMDLEEALTRIKRENNIEDKVESVKEQLDHLVSDFVDDFTATEEEEVAVGRELCDSR